MQMRAWGRTGLEVPVLGQGTWQMEEDDRAGCIRALQAGLDAGLTHVDTAELYGHGEVESLVGEALAGRRDAVFLVSKVLPSNASYEGTLRACEKSLKRLRTDRLDGYLLHWPGSHPLEDTVRAFEKLQQDGKVRSWGVSNFDVPELEQLLRLAGPGRIACNQVLYHLLERRIEHAVVPWCEAHGVAVVAYSPFGSGQFPKATSKGGKVLAEIAKAHGASERQVALAFLVRRPSVLAIPKSSKAERVRENAKAAEVRLSDAELARLDAAFPVGEDTGELPVL
ncbi:aldo/keto reductase [Aggregicoccus sp. 17bor-14]|uniref:aldo/keto reductase n=1 Tax=Myxococcaceae TaxID=31 RepID=UPI00129CE356|nr:MULTISPECIES: aldo/keto reductase [Myxococcaceae]MBF5045081.1 aldo/keto reductase [Simulacricoccus sp. 17bor-14]MRI90823.1 aldo/keto reductase [Aggregicoccus sp. 17bor-14]